MQTGLARRLRLYDRKMTDFTLGRMQNPVRGLLHGSAALLSIAGLVMLVVESSGAATTAAVAIYGSSLVAMYVTSAMYHSVPWGLRWKARLQVLDHTFIYALVAGTFTPLLVTGASSFWMAIGLGGIWGLALLGLVKEMVSVASRRTVLWFQFILGFLVAPAALAMLWGLDGNVATLTLAGGAAYIIGSYFFVNDRPRLFPGFFSSRVLPCRGDRRQRSSLPRRMECRLDLSRFRPSATD